jgi:hypothetical protein
MLNHGDTAKNQRKQVSETVLRLEKEYFAVLAVSPWLAAFL